MAWVLGQPKNGENCPQLLQPQARGARRKLELRSHKLSRSQAEQSFLASESSVGMSTVRPQA